MLDKLKSFFKTQKRNQDYHTLEFLSGEKVNSDELSAVIAAISNISETIASLPLNLYKKEKNGSVLAINHPLFDLIKIAPNETMTPFTLIEAFMVQMLIYGNGFLYPMRKRNGQICSIELIENKDISLFK